MKYVENGCKKFQLFSELIEVSANEANKIRCGKKHFEALDNDVQFTEADSYKGFKEKIEV